LGSFCNFQFGTRVSSRHRTSIRAGRKYRHSKILKAKKIRVVHVKRNASESKVR
jgi:hypothetical protein